MRRYLFTIFADRLSPASREPVSDINTAAVDSLKVLDPKRPIREVDKNGALWIVRYVPGTVLFL
jgi:hypothetical protein